MSVGIEFLFFVFLLHGVVAFFVGFLWSVIPRKSIGLMAFALFLPCHRHLVYCRIQLSYADREHVFRHLCYSWIGWVCIWDFLVGQARALQKEPQQERGAKP